MINYILITFFINFLIFSFYYYFKVNWPEDYFGPEDKFALAISVSFKRLIVFRILPVFGITFLAFSYSDLEIERILLIGLGSLTTSIYGLLTSGISIIKILNNSASVKIFINKATQIAYHMISILTLAIIGGFSGYISSFNMLNLLNSNVRSLVDNIVATIIFSAIFIPIYKLYRNTVKDSEAGIDSIIMRSIDEINSNMKLMKSIKDFCDQYNANFDLVFTFCVVENIQRPKWFRNIENVIPMTTKGIMQVKSFFPIDDSTSIKIAIKNYFKNTSNFTINENNLMKQIKKYNGQKSEKYFSLLERSLYLTNYECYRQLIDSK